MAIEYFHINENDIDMLEQLTELEKKTKAGMNLFNVHAYIRYGRVYAAVEYDEALAAVYFMRDFDNVNRAYLHGVIVSPEETGEHLGQSLLLSAFQDLKDAGLRLVEVTVHPANQKAIRVYREELGFHIINAAGEDEIETEDILILRKTL